MSRTPRVLAMLMIPAALASLPGCLMIGGSPRTMKPTMGQELLDLKSALDHGAMTPEEYDSARQRVLHGKG